MAESKTVYLQSCNIIHTTKTLPIFNLHQNWHFLILIKSFKNSGSLKNRGSQSLLRENILCYEEY
jgi:hypothetical protein